MRTGAGPRLVVLASLAVLVACTPAPPAPAPSAASAVPAVPTTVPVPPSLQQIPGQPPLLHYGTVEDPEVGVAYEYHLFVHCGIRETFFGGRLWRPVSRTFARPARAPSDPGDRPVASSHDLNHLHGSMTLLTPDSARFAWDGGSADFVPTETRQALCA